MSQPRRPGQLTPEEAAAIRQMIVELAAEVAETRRVIDSNLARVERLEPRKAVAA